MWLGGQSNAMWDLLGWTAESNCLYVRGVSAKIYVKCVSK